MINRLVELVRPPKRIISVVPSVTDLLFDLGLADKIVGRTKFCVHPQPIISNYPIIGGTKNLNIERIRQLKPELIIANKEENRKEEIEELARYFPVWVSEVATVDDALKMITKIGEVCKTEKEAATLCRNIKSDLLAKPQRRKLKTALYFIWQNPYMLAGSDTFISEMMQIAGFENIVNQTRYPDLGEEELKKRYQPEYILLSSEPYPFKAKHMAKMQSIFPHATVRLVDGELFSWYGSRMKYARAYFEKLAESLSF